MIKTGYKDKNGEMIYSHHKLKWTDGIILTTWWDIELGWLVCGGFLSGDDLEYYADQCEILKE